ncbi:MAG: LptF/LptG family permease [Niabella sp.]
MKKLDKLIIKAFIGPFVATFFITLFVLIMQFFWLWIDDFVGKGLDAGTILKFIWFQSAVLIPLALPLSVLLSSLMTFGNLGESFELVAIKSAGISLMRFMRPLFVVAGLISLGAFLFSNYVIPVANLKSRTLLADIVLAKPAFAIKEGVFFDGIDKFAIKIGKKEANDSIIRDVIVYQDGGSSLQDNFLIARDGVMKPSADKRFLDIVFKNGWQYQERGSRSDSVTDYIRLGFKEYKMQMDISSFKFKKSDDSANVNNEKMYNMRQLDVAIDSMSRFNKEVSRNFENNMFANLSILSYRDSVTKNITIPDSILNFRENIDVYMGVKKAKDSVKAKADSVKLKAQADSIKRQARKDSIKQKARADADRRKARRDSLRLARNKPVFYIDTLNSVKTAAGKDSIAGSLQDTAQVSRPDSLKKDSAKKVAAPPKKIKKDRNSFDALLPDSARIAVRDRALNSLQGLASNLDMNASSILEQEKTLQKYKIEWHRKISLAMACIVLFMIGAPLGSIIRKGGLGTPMIFAIIFFMIFYFVSTRGEKLAKEMEMSAFLGLWLSTFVLVPIGVFLIYKAMHDSNLFNKEFYTRLRRKILKRLGRG